MVVALGAFHRQSQPDIRGCLDAIDVVLDTVLLFDQAALVGRAVVAVEAGSDLVVKRCVLELVASQLLDGEVVEPLVVVVRPDHPVAPRPHVTYAIIVKYARVTITRGVHPRQSHPFAVTLARQQRVDELLVGARIGVVYKPLDHPRRRRQPGQVKAHPPNECLAICFPRRL